MNFNDGSPSFPSTAINSTRQEQFLPNVDYPTPSDDINNQPPSQGSMAGYGQWNSQNQFQGGTGYRGLGQVQVQTTENENSPSFTALTHEQGHSYNQNRGLGYSGGFSGGYGYDVQGPSVEDMTRNNHSNPSGGNLYAEDKQPSLSDFGRRDTSQTADSATINHISSEDQEFVGMSLVGKNFKKFYPNAYYKEKDEN